MDALQRDLRYALRALQRAPGFSIAVCATLVVCIGPNTAILSALYALVLKPLPFPDARQLIAISNLGDKTGEVRQSSVPQYRDFRDHADLFAGFAVLQHQNITLDSEESPMRVPNDWVSVDFFATLGVQPLRGRFFTPEEELPGQNNVLVLSHDFWLSHYDGDESVIGREIHAAGTTYTIVGIAPAGLGELSKPTCFFQPHVPSENSLIPQARYRGDCLLYARLKPGVPLATGMAQLATIEQRFREHEATPELRGFLEAAGARLVADQLRPGEVRGDMKPLWLLQAGAMLVLLIGAVNVVNLFLARMSARRTELAIRVALGAGQMTLLRQVLVESLLLAGAAAITGLAFAMAAIRVFNAYLPIIVRTAPPVTLQPTVVAIVLAATLLLALGIGLLPHLLLWRTGVRLGQARGSTGSRWVRHASSGLVITQVTLAVVLLIGAGLLIRSFVKVIGIDPGFDATHVVQGRIALPPRYSDAAANLDVQRRILTGLKEIPGVENAAQVNGFGLVTNVPTTPFVMRGDLPGTDRSHAQISFMPVSPDYFATLGMRVLEGRGFNDADRSFGEPVVIVDQTFVERYFPGEQIVGRELNPGAEAPPEGRAWPRIIGVVSRANLAGLEQYDSAPFVFIPMNGWRSGGFNVLVRSPRPTAAVLQDMRRKLHDIDPALPLYATGSLQQGIDAMLMPRRGIMLLLGTFAGLALLLAAIGLYGMLAYDVTQRTREIGIRGALGAERGNIIALILRQGLGKTGAGLGLGLIGGYILSRYLQSLLFEVAPVDPIAYVAVGTGLLAVAALACWLPARRAAKVDPMIALRAE